MICNNCKKEIGDASSCPYCGAVLCKPPLPHHLTAGTLIGGRYRIEGVLGEGGFGITYLGRDSKLGHAVAVKEYYPRGFSYRSHTGTNEVYVSSQADADFYEHGKERFLSEAKTLARFSEEPGVVSVTDYIEENNTVYLVMEYLRGETLQQYFKTHGKLSADESFGMLEPVMKTLEKIHASGVIHRDISPDNIMVMQNGSLKLMDFGAAKEFVDQSRSMSVMLKKGYAPIEQYNSNGKQGPWTDVYALCATVYRCITGKTPVDSLNRVVADTLQKPSTLGASISPATEEVLMRGLAVHQQDRCQNMTELLLLLTQARNVEEARRNEEEARRREEAQRKEEWKKKEVTLPPRPAVIGHVDKDRDLTEIAEDPRNHPTAAVIANDDNSDQTVLADGSRNDPNATVVASDSHNDPNATVVADDSRNDPNATVVASDSHNDPNATVIADMTYHDPDRRKTADRSPKKSKTGMVIAVTAALLAVVIVVGLVIIKPWGKHPKWSDYAISAGDANTIGIKKDGTVIATGSNDFSESDINNWTDISAVSVKAYHTVGLKRNGTVIAAGMNEDGECNVDTWTDITAISAGAYHTVGLKENGTVVAAGMNDDGQCNVNGWTDIVAVSSGWQYTVGLKKDGTVLATGSNNRGQCNVGDWTDIIAISAGTSHTVGLKKDGTVVAVGLNESGQCDVGEWKDVVAVAAGNYHTVGLKKDGTVVATTITNSLADEGQCNVSGWTDIVTVSAGSQHTVGLKKDGTVVATGWNGHGECNVDNWNLKQ